MESISDKFWDVVISGTDLPQSLLALALSRSGKEILHLDANPYYGGAQAALSLQEADDWVANHQSPQSPDAFSAAQVLSRSDSLSFSRAYSLDLAPQIIYARSTLLPQLVSSKAFRQLEFLAVGSFYIYSPSSAAQARPTLNRIPSTREDVFITTSIPPRSKRFLMKFIKFALDYQAEPQAEIWKPNANQPLVTFLESHFNLDSDLQAYLIALTLSLDGKISVEAGLASIHRHLTSIGVFGPGFAAVYPKWGGLSEVAQVGCRAAAVGGATYMLATSVSHYRPSTRSPQDAKSALEVTLSNGLVLQAGALVKNADRPPDAPTSISRLMAIVNSDLTSLFESASEAAPTPCLAIVSFPPRSITLRDATTTTNDVPLYALVLSSLSGQCPAGQCVLYVNMLAGPGSDLFLHEALTSLLAASSLDQDPPQLLYSLQYQQECGSGLFAAGGEIGFFSSPPPDLAFNDSITASARAAWDMITSAEKAVGKSDDYMVFSDREGVDDDSEPPDL